MTKELFIQNYETKFNEIKFAFFKQESENTTFNYENYKLINDIVNVKDISELHDLLKQFSDAFEIEVNELADEYLELYQKI